MISAKKITFVFLTLVSVGVLCAQKVYYVDTQYILKQMPGYLQAKKSLDTTVEKWRGELSDEKDKLEQMRISLENEKVLLTQDQIEQRKKEIDDQKEKLRELTVKRFGANGELISMQRSLVRPIHDQIWNTISKIAKRKGIGIVLDKSDDLVIVYSNPRFDLSDLVIKALKKNNLKK